MSSDKGPFYQFAPGAAAQPEVRQKPSGNLDAVKVPDYQRQLANPIMPEFLQDIADKLVARLADDLSIAPPRGGDDDGRAVTVWMERYRMRFIDLLEDLLVQAAGPALDEDTAARRREGEREDAETVLPQVETELRRFALGRAALRWGARRYPNFDEFGRPEFLVDKRQWIVPLEHTRIHRSIGRITLDNEGNLIESQTTTRGEARQALMHAS